MLAAFYDCRIGRARSMCYDYGSVDGDATNEHIKKYLCFIFVLYPYLS
jgi:hypothetical protein